MNVTAKITYDHEIVTRMVAEAVKAEREACAALCDEYSSREPFSDFSEGCKVGATMCAAVIRARGEA